jgi:hypothetical protein
MFFSSSTMRTEAGMKAHLGGGQGWTSHRLVNQPTLQGAAPSRKADPGRAEVSNSGAFLHLKQTGKERAHSSHGAMDKRL